VSGADNKVIVWNCGTGQPLADIDLVDIPLCVAWNWDGSRIVTSCKDRKLRVLDPRQGTVIKVSLFSLIFLSLLLS
jgi:coronin-1B/1C/6